MPTLEFLTGALLPVFSFPVVLLKIRDALTFAHACALAYDLGLRCTSA